MTPPPPDPNLPRPALVVHADWGVAPAKRWLAIATRGADGRYTLSAPQSVGSSATLFARLQAIAVGPLLIGFDFPLGLPLAYARAAGIADFVAWLPQIGHGRWAEFAHVAARPEQIALTRPFYPQRPGGTRRADLLHGLGLSEPADLLRWCDRATATRRAAAPLFWTLGAQQVGKAALAGWLELLQPAAARTDVALWPFEGSLATLLHTRAIVVAEAYPGEYYHQLGVVLRGSKRNQMVRQSAAPALRAWAAQNDVGLTPELNAMLADGFGADAAGEDRFDALVGACGLLNVVLGNRTPGPPLPADVRRIEGWILGQSERPAGLPTADARAGTIEPL